MRYSDAQKSDADFQVHSQVLKLSEKSFPVNIILSANKTLEWVSIRVTFPCFLGLAQEIVLQLVLTNVSLKSFSCKIK